jgi:hypothetical protein
LLAPTLFALLSASSPAQENASAPADDKYMRAPGTQASLDIPAIADVYYSPVGFNLTGRDQQPWGRISVMQMPQGFLKTKDALHGVQEILENVQGPRSVERPSGQTALFLSGDVRGLGGKERVEAILVGTEERSVLVRCSYQPQSVPAHQREEFERGIARMLETLRFDPTLKVDLLEGLVFTFDPPKGLKISGRVFSDVMFNEHGAVPAKRVDEPFLTVGASERVMPKAQRPNGAQFLHTEASAYDKYSDVRVRSVQPLKRDDGLVAWEAVADARVKKSGEPIVMYLARVYTDDGTYLVNYFGDAKREEQFVPAAKAVAASLKVIPPPAAEK